MAKERDPPPRPATIPTARSSISRSLSHASTALKIERAAAMLSKFSTFRSKRTSNQKGKQFERFSSQYHSKEVLTSKSDIPYGLPKPILADETDSEASYGRPVVPNSEASPAATHISDGSSSLSSFRKYATYDGNESQNTSVLSEETDAGPSVLLPYEDAEEQFLEDYEGYFLHLSVDNIRKDQYPKLELQRIVYLDYASCSLYSRYQVEQHMQFLLEETDAFLGSNYATEKQSVVHNNYADCTSEHILNLLNTTQNEYSTIFTPGLPSCYHLLGEMYNLKKGTHVLASHDHHKSVRHFIHAASAQSKVRTGVIPLKSKDLCAHGNDMHKLLRKHNSSGHGCGLLIYPAQSFLSGICHPLSWIVGAQQNGWEVLLDVSSCLPMVRIDLSLYQPEFVIGSLHHMLGYPSGVAFLLVRRSSHSLCIERGSAQLKLARLPDNGKNVHVVAEGENLNTHIFAASSFGFEHLERIGIVAIQKRVESLVTWLVKTLKSLKHKLEERPLLQLYGSLDLKFRGSILAFNILDSTGNIFPARLVQQLAEKTNIFLGVGTLGDLTVYNILDQKSDKQVESASSYADTYNFEVVRLSLGPISTFSDVYRLAQFLCRFSDEDYMSSEAAGYVEELENAC